MEVQRLASFSHDGMGGNPAGVVISDELPSAQSMQEIAARVGYSETAFAMPYRDGFKVRYYAPTMEVPFCGHATIALGAALGAQFGVGTYPLYLSHSNITVDALQEGSSWGARLTSPRTSQTKMSDTNLNDILSLFGWTHDDLDTIEPTFAHAGADHALIFLKDSALLSAMSYNFDKGLALMRRLGLITINCLYRSADDVFSSRNAFASGGVVEDPATGAAAAALGGYLRDCDLYEAEFTVIQGVDMGCPSRLSVDPLSTKGAGILVSGSTRSIQDT
jgi:PhzF family phenazine biosynthesis protein